MLRGDVISSRSRSNSVQKNKHAVEHNVVLADKKGYFTFNRLEKLSQIVLFLRKSFDTHLKAS